MESLIGSALPRREDERLVRGQGRYVTDLAFPGQLFAVFVRSSHAHARLGTIDIRAALQVPGILAVLTAPDLGPAWKPLPGSDECPRYPLARDVVRHVGEPVAVVIAENRYRGEDAAERVAVDYDPLPAVTDVEAPASEVPLFPGRPDNVYLKRHETVGDGRSALDSAPVVVEATLRLARVAGQPMEPRGIVAHPGGEGGVALTVYEATQGVHGARTRIAGWLGLPEDRVRVLAPDVGGGFGVKNGAYPEEALVPYLALRWERPVAWLGDRLEEFLATNQSREQVHHARLGVSREGRIIALVDHFDQDNGAYPAGGPIVLHSTLFNMAGPYRIGHVDVIGRGILTNKVPVGPYRGAGRPEANFVIERLLDRAADALGMDRAEIRRRNLVRPADLPHATGLGPVLENGDYPTAFAALLEQSGYEAFRDEQSEARSHGRYLGLGVAAYLESSGGAFEMARLTLQSDGTVLLATGAASQGQGHETALSQVVAASLDVPLEAVRVVEGDTAAVPRGIGTFGSRTMVTAGGSARQAAVALRTQIIERAADLLEAHPDDLDWDQGTITVAGVPARRLTLRDLAAAAPEPLAAEAADPVSGTFGFGGQAIKVSVDPETGIVSVLECLIVHDGGRIVNPLLAEGQIVGAAVQGLGTALFEEVSYDQDGQPINTSFIDYLLPSADTVPEFRLIHHTAPAAHIPGGFKGIGEAGIIPSQAALAAAVEDALAPFGFVVDRMPVRPQTIVMHMRQSREGGIGR